MCGSSDTASDKERDTSPSPRPDLPDGEDERGRGKVSPNGKGAKALEEAGKEGGRSGGGKEGAAEHVWGFCSL